jgi:hypothetical protein
LTQNCLTPSGSSPRNLGVMATMGFAHGYPWYFPLSGEGGVICTILGVGKASCSSRCGNPTLRVGTSRETQDSRPENAAPYFFTTDVVHPASRGMNHILPARDLNHQSPLSESLPLFARETHQRTCSPGLSFPYPGQRLCPVRPRVRPR